MTAPAPLLQAFEDARRSLWGLAYRVTGCAADAHDVVQETFARALQRPPEDLDAPLRPWLSQVALNLARDALRTRKRAAHVGPWLPSPVDTPVLAELDAEPAEGTAETRYGLRESASFAFLLALEVLTPQQRAVLVLRDVLDHSVRETAEALSLSEANVKVIHHRARRSMLAYDGARPRAGAPVAAETLARLEQFFGALLRGDVPAARSVLTEDARVLADGGGEYVTALRPVLGADRVARFFAGLQHRYALFDARYALRSLNGAPAIVGELDGRPPRYAPRVVLRAELARDARIAELHVVVAPRKLAHVAAVG